MPAVVAGVPGCWPCPEFELLPPPPQPLPAATAMTHNAIRTDAQRRRRDGMPKRTRTARIEPPPPMPHSRIPGEGTTDALDAAVVFTVNVEVPLPPDDRVTLVGFKLHVGKLCAPVGEVVRLQDRFIVPVYVLPALRVTVAVAVDPGVMGEGAEIPVTTGATTTLVVALAVA